MRPMRPLLCPLRKGKREQKGEEGMSQGGAERGPTYTCCVSVSGVFCGAFGRLGRWALAAKGGAEMRSLSPTDGWEVTLYTEAIRGVFDLRGRRAQRRSQKISFVGNQKREKYRKDTVRGRTNGRDSGAEPSH